MPRVSQNRWTTAFTLIELLTVIAVIAILAGIALGSVRGVKQRANIARARSELAVLAIALEEFKRHYGDYPKTGPALANSHRVTTAANGISAGPGLTTAQAILFNALTGAYGVTGVLGGRVNGPMFVDISKLTLEVTLTTATQTTFGVPTGTPPAKTVANNSFVDPWGNRYLYFYKRPTPPTTSTGPTLPGLPGIPGRPAPTAQAWLAPSYVLSSVGPDGASTTLPNAGGIFTGTTQTTGDNADNIYADKLP
ncbi:MAG: prepilin-type N-terminal cleavage/methylation domain-containing protein [Opitutus sp.]|nr:prepilin-type N-terminal cleavage/methylation domain-containing protein [Opitutus sp.]